MIHTILVPLDGSQVAERALPEASRLAGQEGATIALVRAAHASALTADPVAAQLAAVTEAEDYLAAIANRLIRAGLPVSTHVFYESPATAIRRAAALLPADIIVMSTHGRSGLSRALLGSVAQSVVHEADMPILLVRARHSSQGPYRAILVPLDGTDLAERALQYVADAAFARQAEITLVRSAAPMSALVPLVAQAYVLESIYEQEEDDAEKRRAAARAYLEARAQTYLNGQPWHAFVTLDDPHAMIVHIAHDEGVDLIVMATHGRAGLDRLMHGSIAAQVLHRTKVPLLLLPAVAASAGVLAHV